MVLYGNIRSPLTNFNNRFLSDSDTSGTKINVNVKTRNFDVQSTRKPNGKTSGSLKLKDALQVAGRQYNMATQIKTGDEQKFNLNTKVTDELELRVGAIAKQPAINSAGKVTDNAGASFGATYQTSKFGLAADVDYVHQKQVQLSANGAFVYKNFVAGGKTKFNVQEKDFQAALKNLEVDARADFGDYSTFLNMSDEFNGVKGGVQYKVNDKDSVFAESEYKVNKENSVKVAVGLHKALDSGATAALRLNNDFQIGAVYSARINNNLKGTVAAAVDTSDANTSKVGLNLDFSF